MTDGADLVLEQFADRFDEGKFEVWRKPADVVVALDGDRGAPDGRGAFDDVGVQGPLCQEFHGSKPACLGGKNVDKGFADDLAFFFGVGDALQVVEKQVLGMDHMQIQAERRAEGFLDLPGFVVAEQAVIHENAVQLFADGLVDQHGDNR